MKPCKKPHWMLLIHFDFRCQCRIRTPAHWLVIGLALVVMLKA